MHSDSTGELHDAALFHEIRLLEALVLAASAVARHLTPHEVDRVLQLEDPVPWPALGDRRADRSADGYRHDDPSADADRRSDAGADASQPDVATGLEGPGAKARG